MSWRHVGLAFFALAAFGMVVLLHDVRQGGSSFLGMKHPTPRRELQGIPVECIANKLTFLDMLHSNLGGSGPDAGEESMLFDNVFPARGENIRLKITALTPYVPANAFHNTVSGAYGQINLQANSTVTLNFQFLNALTGEPVTIGPFMMAFLDFDTPKSGGAEVITVSGFNRFKTSDNTEVAVAAGPLGSTFSSTAWGTGKDNPADPLLLTELQKQRTVELFFPETMELTMTLEMRTSLGSDGRNIMFTGPTSLTCPERTTTTTTTTVEPQECRSNKLNFLELLHSNLGGLGPDTGVESMVFNNVFPDVGENVQLHVKALSPYTPANVKHNKVSGAYGQINVQANTTVKLSFRFVRAKSGEPIAIGPFMMSFLDFDSPKRGGAEMVRTSGFTRFQTGIQTEVVSTTVTDGVSFSSTTWGTAQDNPVDPLLLTELQKRRTVELFFPESSEIEISMEMWTKPGTGGRNVMFTGPTSLSCLERTTTTTTTVNVHHLCSATLLDLGNQIHNNLGGHGPDLGEETMVFANVFPFSGQDVKLVVSVVGSYKTKHRHPNEVSESLVKINVLENSDVTLMFSFVKAKDETPVVMGPFMLTFLDFDGSSGGMNEVVTVKGFSNFRLFDNTDVRMDTVDGALAFSSTKVGTAKDDPWDAFHLTAAQLQQSVGVLYPALSHFHVKLSVPSKGRNQQRWSRNFMFAGATNLICEAASNPSSTATTMAIPSETITTTVGPMGLCQLIGDPHIKPFDSRRGHVDIYSYGDYWLVQSESVLIQGRYGAAHPNGNSRVAALAIGGAFLDNHTLVIELDKTMWDGHPILDDGPSYTSNFLSATAREIQRPRNGVTLQFKLRNEVTLTINRWTTHLDVLISMRRAQGGQDGHCGNFNLDASDDTKHAILARSGQEIPEAQLLFPSKVPHGPQPADRTLDDCVKLNEALDSCRRHLGSKADSGDVQACAMDFCFGDEDMATKWGATVGMWRDESCQSKQSCKAGAGITAIAVASELGKPVPQTKQKCVAMCKEVAEAKGFPEKSCCTWTAKPKKVCKSSQSHVTDKWCNDNCNHKPAHCPSICRCNKEASCQLQPPGFTRAFTNSRNRHICVLGATR